MPRGLTVLAPILPGREAALHEVLEAHPIRFLASRLVHFARLAVLDDPDRGPDRRRLLLATSYDGELRGHLAELLDLTPDLDALFSPCEGYEGRAGFEAFIEARTHEPQAFYVAFREESVVGLRRALAVRRRFEELIDRYGAPFLDDPARATAPEAWPGVYPELVASAGALPVPFASVRLAASIVHDGVVLLTRHGPIALLRGLKRITASLDRLPLARAFNRLTGNAMPPVKSPFSSVAVQTDGPCAPVAAGDEIPSRNATRTPRFDEEDVVTQNALTLVTTIGPGGRASVEAVLALIDGYARRLAPPGSLAGISTIHFVRWLVIDGGRRLMMISDYDGSWEAYIDEFAEMILSGLDAIWGTAGGFPPDGARDLAAFKRFLRCHQVPAAYYYGAYPEATVLNLRRDLRLATAVAEGLRDRRTGGWREHV